MYLVDFMAALVGRDLTKEEDTLLRHLTAQGLAKINVDLGRGLDVESMLEDLRKVHRALQRRRHERKMLLPKSAKRVIAQLGRPVTTTEMIFIEMRCHGTQFLPPFDKEGFLQKDVDLDALVLSFQDDQIAAEESMVWSMARSPTASPVSPPPASGAAATPSRYRSPLITVHCPRVVSTTHLLCDAETATPAVALSPVLTWFKETDPVNLEIPDEAALSILMEVQNSVNGLSEVPSSVTNSTTRASISSYCGSTLAGCESACSAGGAPPSHSCCLDAIGVTFPTTATTPTPAMLEAIAGACGGSGASSRRVVRFAIADESAHGKHETPPTSTTTPSSKSSMGSRLRAYAAKKVAQWVSALHAPRASRSPKV